MLLHCNFCEQPATTIAVVFDESLQGPPLRTSAPVCDDHLDDAAAAVSTEGGSEVLLFELRSSGDSA